MLLHHCVLAILECLGTSGWVKHKDKVLDSMDSIVIETFFVHGGKIICSLKDV